eukprot:TRINITY_DN1194_c1_g1_i2.p1 TRINITY_DN1194_c1_g1~~TRINITY_DN1194_c1_g1_i2.p1  ORF type:complete len:362 (-),score=64.37 TRINITY_DN1194_c1_g1_i2:49-1134(-)
MDSPGTSSTENSPTTGEPRSPRDIFDIPMGMSKAEWLRINTEGVFLFFHTLYEGLLRHKCTTETCPDMSAGPQYQFLWAEGPYRESPAVLPAKQYIDLLVKWAKERIAPFGPYDAQAPVSKDFQSACEQIWSRTLRIVMHIYWSHWEIVGEEGAVGLVNGNTKHYITFALKYKLLTNFESIAPISNVLLSILPAYYKQQLEEMGKDGSTKLKERENKVRERRTSRKLAGIRRQALLLSAQRSSEDSDNEAEPTSKTAGDGSEESRGGGSDKAKDQEAIIRRGSMVEFNVPQLGEALRAERASRGSAPPGTIRRLSVPSDADGGTAPATASTTTTKPTSPSSSHILLVPQQQRRLTISSGTK